MAFFCPGSHSASKAKKGGKSKKMAPSPLDRRDIRTNVVTHPKIMVVQDFIARDLRELNVCRGVMVELLGGEKEWVYVQTEEGQKGFIPRSHCMVLPPEGETQRVNGGSGLTASLDILNGDVGIEHSISSPVRPSSAGFQDEPQSHSSPFNLDRRRRGSRSSTCSNISDRAEKRVSRTSKGSQTGRQSMNDSVFHPDLAQNGSETRMSESDLQKLRCRPLPSLPDSSDAPQDDKDVCSPYYTIHRETSMSPEPSLQREPRETTPYADLDSMAAHSFVLNAVSRRRHGSVNDYKRRICTTDAAPPIYRTSSDEPTGRSRFSFGSGGPMPDPAVAEEQSEVSRFRKVMWGVYVAISNFRAVDENEISIVKGERVSLLNHDDPQWYWVVRLGNSEEGFVPRNCLREHLAGQPEPEYEQVIPRARPRQTNPHNVRSRSLPRNAGMKCFSSFSVLEDKGQNSPMTRGSPSRPRHSSPAGPQEWQLDQGYSSPYNPTNRKSGDGFMGELPYDSSAGQPAYDAMGHPLQHSTRHGNPPFYLERFKRHSADEQLLHGVSNGPKSDDSGITTDDVNGGTLV